MWLMTRIGFFSVVQKPDNQHLTIRSRHRDDLTRLRQHYLPSLTDSQSQPGSEYPWRAKATHDAFAKALALIAKDIDYPVVQDELSHSLGASRAAAGGKAWSMLSGTTDDAQIPAASPWDGLPWSAAMPAGKAVAYGAVIMDARGNLLLREVKNHYDGYVWTFAKGRPDPGETPRQTALREVFEETGVVARILTPVPGEFLGGTTINRYFLMLATPDVTLAFDNAETSSLCWATPDQARERLGLTTNATGRKRDLAVLEAALACLPQPLASPIASREDWKTRPMPALRRSISIPRNIGHEFDETDMADIRCGLLPKEMEDKWFVYYEDGVLYLHRSWTGNCIYRVNFAQFADGWRATAVDINMHPRQHNMADATSEAGLARLFTWLDMLCRRGAAERRKTVSDKPVTDHAVKSASDVASGDVSATTAAMNIALGAMTSGHSASSSGETSIEASQTQLATPAILRKRFLGCLLGGAVGDALGAPVEFMKRAEILHRFGPDGITDYAPAYGGLGTITDDTQMTLFTAEGLLRAWVRGAFKGITTYPGVVAHAYLRWLHTQGEQGECDVVFGEDKSGWLFGHHALHARRAPGHTCLSSLRDMPSLGVPAKNNSKGCGGVMRMAPVGLFAQRFEQLPQLTFEIGTELAALTHGHPTGSLTGGVFAVLVQAAVGGASWTDALDIAKACLRAAPTHQETLAAIEHAERLAASGRPSQDAIAELGQGWVAEEALAISIYCALVAIDFKHGVVMAVNHDGDSDSTGSMVGNLLGAKWGVDAIPSHWLAQLELSDVIAELAGDLYDFADWDVGEYAKDSVRNQKTWDKYPGF
ncbi:NUDIX domain-containing protein [Pigmentiphaga aceris]|uniref:NUDIX domain-containing protein n=1 Tax=Pigmentiphaga aceris TaxID=1940612 RepID=A0A5C0B4Y2_9BURK|nr:ADP-ribosylglycohydrolase family protein [Pigmentiphaga aceris]QEI08906.1 NUDIX domain-containing protein [Pigmentiphaga aceris]